MNSMNQAAAHIRRNITEAAKQSGRDPDRILLMAVTKTRSLEQIRQVIECGITLIGENRVQELQQKAPHLAGVTKHCIGPLQSNKVKAAVAYSDCIQTVEREKILTRIDRCAEEQGKVMDIMMEFNTSREPQKHGLVSLDDLLRLIELSRGMDHVRFVGLMTMGPLDGTEDETRSCFSRLYEIREQVYQRFPEYSDKLMLSMGMSGDYTIAVEEGSDLLRIGGAFFPQEQL